ncbi:hypothetical protein ACOQFL_02140 [Actinopolyspora sp. H202]|uniref:Rv0361 family membrane protein n=1 Tax=Actinopolyspora sp. H202 TaxID=1500456 RepID=UPI003EE6770C
MTHPPQNPDPNDPRQQQNWGQQGGYPGGQYPESGQQPAWGQQYGQDPYGQQPGGQYPQSSGQPAWGQQYGQPNPYGQQPGGQYPQSGPQQAWGQQQTWGQPQQGFPGDPNAYPPYAQPGGPYPPQQRKSKLPWILGGTGGGILVLGGIIVLLFMVLGGPGDPKDTAQEYVNKINEKDFKSVSSLTCEKIKNSEDGDISQYAENNFIETMKNKGATTELARKIYDGLSFDMSLEGVTEEADRKAVAHVTGTMTINPDIAGSSKEVNEYDQKFNMIVEDGEWKVCESVGSSTG